MIEPILVPYALLMKIFDCLVVRVKDIDQWIADLEDPDEVAMYEASMKDTVDCCNELAPLLQRNELTIQIQAQFAEMNFKIAALEKRMNAQADFEDWKTSHE